MILYTKIGKIFTFSAIIPPPYNTFVLLIWPEKLVIFLQIRPENI